MVPGGTMKIFNRVILLIGLVLLACTGCEQSGSGQHTGGGGSAQPNILFIVLDDIAVDQLEVFGYGGKIPAATASIDAIAQHGVRFRNAWSMPTCSPSRAAIFNGQYPFRTHILNAIQKTDLANSQMSPYMLTTPELLGKKGYVSALIGKIHITGNQFGPNNHPLGNNAMRDLGWDYFAGYSEGGPYPIDTTAGGIAPEGTYQCGWVPNNAADRDNGADTGICYLPDGGYIEMFNTAEYPSPGRTCVEKGGIFDPGADVEYSEVRRTELKFENQNGYYTARWVINHGDGSVETLLPSDPAVRGYRTTVETDRAIDWIKRTREQQPGQPWMLTLGYSALHAPLQPPPAELLPHPDAMLSLKGCGAPAVDVLADLGLPRAGELYDAADFANQRIIYQHMLEAVDHEIGRLLATIGVVKKDESGNVVYRPDSNTVLVIVGDNGTYAPSVKPPFDYVRAKGTPYQTGVWVPLIVAGSVVNNPGRDVEHMVNIVDLYSLFAELAGYDHADLTALIAPQQLDAQPLMPYLVQPGHEGIRATNFTEVGSNISDETAPPCVIQAINTCIQLFTSKGVCIDQGGEWYGPDSDISGVPAAGFPSCAAVNDYLVDQGEEPADIYPSTQQAMRDAHYKLVRIVRQSSPDCDSESCQTVEYEFYEINQDPETPKLDREQDNLLKDGKTVADLTDEQQQHYRALHDKLNALLNSAVNCPGDGNRDLIVDQQDVVEWKKWANTNGGNSSWYDFNHDGMTDSDDREIIESHMGTACPR